MAPKACDKRWQNFDPLPVIVLLFIFSALIISLSASELHLGFSIFPLVILLISSITFIHTFLDIVLYLTGHLQPVYALSMSVIMMIFWLAAVGFGAADIAKAAAGSNHQYCTVAFTQEYFQRLGCIVPKARLGAEVAVLILYTISTTMASLAHDRHTTFVRSELQAQCSHHVRSPPALAPTARPVVSVPVVAVAENTVDDITPAIPPRAAARLNSWVFEEGEKLPVFTEVRQNGTRRVLSVRNA